MNSTRKTQILTMRIPGLPIEKQPIIKMSNLTRKVLMVTTQRLVLLLPKQQIVTMLNLK